jgi:hypothetical protein
MSSTNPERSIPNTSTMRTTMRRSISARSASLIWSIASQKRRWSSAAVGIRNKRSQAVFAHQSAKASFEHGSVTRLSVARAM